MAGSDESRVTYAEAAEVLGCHVSAVPKMVRRGWLKSERRRDGALERAEVEALAQRRRQPRVVAATSSTPAPDPSPDIEHEWLPPSEVAELVGRTPQAVVKRIHRERLPATRKGHRWWVRYDHLELVERARLVQATRRP